METYIMPTIVLGLAILGGVGTWFTLKARTDELWERSKASQQEAAQSRTAQATQHEGLQNRIVQLEIRVERECVKKDDLERVEDRIAKRIDTVEHTVRNTATQIISSLSGRRAPGERA